VTGATTNRFSAAASSLGYAYQFRFGLLKALERQQTGLGWAVALEAADDLEYTGEGEDALLQLKHRAPGTVITDAAPDLWKSLRVWSELAAAGKLAPSSTQLFLITTATAGAASTVSRLEADPGERNNKEIAEALSDVAANSENKALVAATSSFLALSAERRTELVSAIHLVTSSPDITQVDEKIRALSRLMVRSEHVDAFMERLEGWWNRRCLRQLVLGYGAAVHGDDFDAKLTDLREQFHQDNLPIDEDVAEDRPEVDRFLDQMFCKQLELIDIAVTRVRIAVRDYHRAFVQRSRWSHDGLLKYGELAAYERELLEAWELLFERMKDELGESASDEAQLEAAKRLYAWAETADFPIRPACTATFVSRGSLHMLADELRLGWHPDFELRLTELLVPEAAAEGAG
jgi:hypothetical protein